MHGLISISPAISRTACLFLRHYTIRDTPKKGAGLEGVSANFTAFGPAGGIRTPRSTRLGLPVGRVTAAGTVWRRCGKADGGPIARSAVRAAPAIGVTLKQDPSRQEHSADHVTQRPQRRH